jgi:hypothetical protein
MTYSAITKSSILPINHLISVRTLYTARFNTQKFKDLSTQCIVFCMDLKDDKRQSKLLDFSSELSYNSTTLHKNTP